MLENKKIAIIIPAFNEEGKIVEVVNSIPDDICGIKNIIIIVVDDGSQDNTSKVVLERTKAKLVRHRRNQGLGVAINTGIKTALKNKVDYLVHIDADGQFSSGDIHKLLLPIIKGETDCATASRLIKKEDIPKNMPKIKIFGNKMMSKIVSFIAGNEFFDVSCGFRAYNKEALLRVNLFGRFTYTQEMILDLCFKNLSVKEIPIEVHYFEERKSAISGNLFRYAYRTLSIILQIFIDYKPFAFFGGIGFLLVGAGMMVNVFMLLYYINTGMFTPYKFLGALGIFLVIIGILFIVVALIANMLKRVRIVQDELLYYEKKKHYYNA